MSPPGERPGPPPLSPAVSERRRRRLILRVACAGNGAAGAAAPVWTVPRAVGDTTGAPRRRPATMTSPSTDQRDLAALPIGMFDSGMGGLTVLHECLVTLPGENFAYVGDTARFPYGEKSRDELELFAQQLTAFLESVPVKLRRRGLLLGHLGGAAAAAGALLHADRRRGHAGRASGGADLALPPHRRARHRGHGRQRRLPARHPQPRRRRRGHPAGLPRPRLVHRGGRRGEPGARRRGARLHRAAEGEAPGRRDHGLHALPAHRAHAAALSGARRHAREPGRRDRPRGRRHPAAAGPRAAPTTAWARTASTPPATSRRFARVGARFLQMPLTRVRKLSLDTLGALVAP